MCYRLFKRITDILLVSFRRPNGVVTTKTWNHSGRRKSLTGERPHTQRIECARSKQLGLNAEKVFGTESAGGDFSLDIHSYRTIRIDNL